MATMQVQNKGAVEVPTHLAGAVSAGNMPRVLAHLYDALFVLLLGGVSVGWPLWFAVEAGFNHDVESSDFYFGIVMIGILLISIFGLVQFGLMIFAGRSLGMIAAGIRWVSFTTGTKTVGGNFGKYLLRSIISSVTAGIGYIVIVLVTQDATNRHWLDRQTGIITLNVRAGRDTVKSASFAPSTDTQAPFVAADPFAVPTAPANPYGMPAAAPVADPFAAAPVADSFGVSAPVDPFASAVPANPYGVPAAPEAPVAVDPFAASPVPAADPFAMPVAPGSAPEPFAPAPVADPFAAPVDPFTASAPAPAASADPFGMSPAPEASRG